MKPTVGRTVHFHPTAGVTHAAIIAYVHSDTMVNLAVFDDNGKAYGQPSVQLVAPGTPKPEFGFYCDWMSYQVEQAKKNEDEAVNAVASSPPGAPRITPEHVQSVIKDCAYHHFFGTTMTVCSLTLKNGFSVLGESACANPDLFDPELGRKLARVNAEQKIWQLEGYLLRERLNS